jgi:hypothetical protein
MAVEAYIVSEACFESRPIPESHVVTLYDADGENAAGSMTTNHPIEPGLKGALTFVGLRGPDTYEVAIGRIEVRNASAVGFEFTVVGPITRELVHTSAKREVRDPGLEERIEIR